jgi:predicted DNA-binding protein
MHTMKRTNIHLTNKQLRQLGQLAKQTELPVAEHIRRAIDDYLDRMAKNGHLYTDTNNKPAA